MISTTLSGRIASDVSGPTITLCARPKGSLLSRQDGGQPENPACQGAPFPTFGLSKELAAEVAALEGDEQDRDEMLAIAELMEALRAPR